LFVKNCVDRIPAIRYLLPPCSALILGVYQLFNIIHYIGKNMKTNTINEYRSIDLYQLKHYIYLIKPNPTCSGFYVCIRALLFSVSSLLSCQRIHFVFQQIQIIMRATFLISLFIFVGIPFCNCQSGATIRNVDFQLVENRLVITYDIANYKYSDKFNITPRIYKVSGEQINAKTFTGDLINVLGGPSKKITWDIEKDNILLNDDVYVVITGEKIEEVKPEKTTVAHAISRGACFFESVIFPGWGSARLTRKNGHLVKGFLGYGAVVSAIVFNAKAGDAYDSYKRATSYTDRNDYFNQVEDYRLYSIISAAGAGVIWGIDLITVLAVKNKTLASSPSASVTIGCKSINSSPALALRLNF
jgi:hypothetical protein